MQKAFDQWLMLQQASVCYQEETTFLQAESFMGSADY